MRKNGQEAFDDKVNALLDSKLPDPVQAQLFQDNEDTTNENDGQNKDAEGGDGDDLAAVSNEEPGQSDLETRSKAGRHMGRLRQ